MKSVVADLLPMDEPLACIFGTASLPTRQNKAGSRS